MAGSIDDSAENAQRRSEAPGVDGDRHYQQDPDALLDRARDADERAQDDLLEIDQTELEELGLVLDDPHQPEPE